MCSSITVLVGCIPLVSDGVEHLLLCLFAILMFFLEKCLFRSSARIFIVLFLLLIEFGEFLIYFECKRFIVYVIYRYFHPVLSLFFIFLRM